MRTFWRPKVYIFSNLRETSYPVFTSAVSHSVSHAKKRCHSFRKACTVIKSRAVGREVSKYTEPVILAINIETFRDWLASKNAAVE